MIIDFRTTQYGPEYNSDSHVPAPWFEKSYRNNNFGIAEVRLFPNDCIVATVVSKRNEAEIIPGIKGTKFRVEPADIYVLKLLWDIADAQGRGVIKQHIKRAKHPLQQYKAMRVRGPETAEEKDRAILSWWMAVWLGDPA